MGYGWIRESYHYAYLNEVYNILMILLFSLYWKYDCFQHTCSKFIFHVAITDLDGEAKLWLLSPDYIHSDIKDCKVLV